MMNRDIKNRKDIEYLIVKFYEKVKVDDNIGYYFTKIVDVKWELHLEIMCNFWENILFQTGHYEGNPMQKHQEMNASSPLKLMHFEQWTKLFSQTIDENFKGDIADTAKQRAISIAKIMVEKLNLQP